MRRQSRARARGVEILLYEFTATSLTHRPAAERPPPEDRRRPHRAAAARRRVPGAPDLLVRPAPGSCRPRLLLKGRPVHVRPRGPLRQAHAGQPSVRDEPACQWRKDPVWNADHTLEILDGKGTPLEVFDKEQVGNDKFMGHARVSIVDWIAAGTFTGDVDGRIERASIDRVRST